MRGFYKKIIIIEEPDGEESIDVTFEIKWWNDPGCYSSANGDPGDPPDIGFERKKTIIDGTRPMWLTDELIEIEYEKIEWDDLDIDS